jgi:RNA polymerase sigma-70 factor (ECF subfamily)
MDADDADLLAKVRDGDEQAAASLFQRYVGQLVALAQSQLDSRLGRRVDAEDIVQSAFRSFFRRTREGHFVIGPDEDLWRLLAVMTLTKLRKQVEFHTAQKRDVQQEQACGATWDSMFERASKEPSPADLLAIVEVVDQIAAQLGRQQQQIFAMRLQGDQLATIAAAVGVSERTVRRVLERIKALLRDQLVDEQDQRALSWLEPESLPEHDEQGT